ncbi:hypothetical protein V8F20_005380 [Naviculisporaceae sp. PSN 640]
MDSATSIVNAKVYTGIWVNWSRGPVMGSTLTLTRRDGNLLIAFTAFFIGFIASRAWRIISFALHRYYSTPEARDALHHQRQAVLRNSETPGWSFWTLGQIAWAWRRSPLQSQPGPEHHHNHRRRVLAVVMPTLLASVLCMAAFAIASGFSSQMTTADRGGVEEVLIDGTNCGMVTYTVTRDMAFSKVDLMVTREDSRRRNDAVNYAQQCYDATNKQSQPSDINSGGVFDCNLLARPNLVSQTGSGPQGASINTNAPCPFSKGLCQTGDSSGNLLLDTGYIDSHEHLGLNSHKQDRIAMRQRYHCAPLRTEGFEEDVKDEEDGITYTRYNYGPIIKRAINSTGQEHIEVQNYTLMVRGLDAQYPDPKTRKESTGISESANFLLPVYQSQTINGSVSKASRYVPLPELQRADGSVEVIFLVGNGVGFPDQSVDPWYRVSNVTAGNFYATMRKGSLPYYRPAEAASPLGCVEQFQFCRSSDMECGPLAAWLDAITGAAPLFDLTPEEVVKSDKLKGSSLSSRFIWYTQILNYMSLTASMMPIFPSSSKLSSEDFLERGFQFGLGEAQWQRDVSQWWSTWLSMLQIGFLDTARGPPASFSDYPEQVVIARPADGHMQDMCYNQKVQSRGRHVSFSMFGLCFVFVAGSLIFLVSYLLEPIFAFDWRGRFSFFRLCGGRRASPEQSGFARKGTRNFKNLEWDTTDVLHLQALSFHCKGKGTWAPRSFGIGSEGAGVGSVPVTTEPGEVFEPLITSCRRADGSHAGHSADPDLMGSGFKSGSEKGSINKVDVVEVVDIEAQTHTEHAAKGGLAKNMGFVAQVPRRQETGFSLSTVATGSTYIQGGDKDEQDEKRVLPVAQCRT